MKYLGVDFGTKRVGIAVSDEVGEFAFPRKILATADAVKEIAKLCIEEQVGAIVIGKSIATNEEENIVAKAASAFANALVAHTKLPIEFEREDFSSMEAHRYQIKAGSRDDSAAAIILQRFLDKKK